MTASNTKFIITGGAGFIGSNLTLSLQEEFPNAHLTVIDDFRSGDFKNLAGYRGDFVAENLARLDWRERFGGPTATAFDAIFHLASITDTTLHDQFVQVHDNVESFRRLLNFARPTKTRVIYASSASTYGAVTAASLESNGAAPANVYSFSKVIMDNIAMREARENPDWIIIGLRYFNVYGPREAHKGMPASMIYNLAQQMKSGQRPRIFKHGEQKRDFVYVKDVVEVCFFLMNNRQHSGIYNLGTGEARTFLDLTLNTFAALDRTADIRFRDTPEDIRDTYQYFTQAEMQKLLSIGYDRPFTRLEDGINDYVRNYLVPGLYY